MQQAAVPQAAQQPAIQQPAQQPAAQQPAAQQDTAGRRPPPKRIIMNGSSVPPPPVTPAPTPTPVPPTPGAANADSSVNATAASSGNAPIDPTAAADVVRSSALAGAFDAANTIDAARSRMAENKTSMNRYGVEIQKKFALSAACMVFVLIGAPIALRFPRGGVGLVIGVSLVVFAIYYVGLIAGESLADRAYLTPFWAMWAANVILTIVGIVLMVRMGREGATSRGGDMSEFLESFRAFWARAGRRFGLPLERRHRTA